MSPNFKLSPTPSSWNIPASTGFTPRTTLSPLYKEHNGLLRRDTTVGRNTCGWINGDQNQPFTCVSSSTCVADPQYTAFGCCDSIGDCYFATVCLNYNPGICFSSAPGDCFHYQYTIGCVGSGGCVTYVMPGGVPFSSFDCIENPGTVYIDTTYAGGIINQQVPMPYTSYLVAASSASSASSSAAEASATSDSDSSDTAASDWVSHHKTLLIGVIVAAIVFLLLCCCTSMFLRRKRRNRAGPAPAPPGAPPAQYQYGPQQGLQGQEHYPMVQYQYGPNK